MEERAEKREVEQETPEAAVIRKIPEALEYFDRFKKMPVDGQQFVAGFIDGFNMAAASFGAGRRA